MKVIHIDSSSNLVLYGVAKRRAARMEKTGAMFDRIEDGSGNSVILRKRGSLITAEFYGGTFGGALGTAYLDTACISSVTSDGKPTGSIFLKDKFPALCTELTAAGVDEVEHTQVSPKVGFFYATFWNYDDEFSARLALVVNGEARPVISPIEIADTLYQTPQRPVVSKDGSRVVVMYAATVYVYTWNKDTEAWDSVVRNIPAAPGSDFFSWIGGVDNPTADSEIFGNGAYWYAACVPAVDYSEWQMYPLLENTFSLDLYSHQLSPDLKKMLFAYWGRRTSDIYEYPILRYDTDDNRDWYVGITDETIEHRVTLYELNLETGTYAELHSFTCSGMEQVAAIDAFYYGNDVFSQNRTLGFHCRSTAGDVEHPDGWVYVNVCPPHISGKRMPTYSLYVPGSSLSFGYVGSEPSMVIRCDEYSTPTDQGYDRFTYKGTMDRNTFDYTPGVADWIFLSPSTVSAVYHVWQRDSGAYDTTVASLAYATGLTVGQYPASIVDATHDVLLNPMFCRVAHHGRARVAYGFMRLPGGPLVQMPSTDYSIGYASPWWTSVQRYMSGGDGRVWSLTVSADDNVIRLTALDEDGMVESVLTPDPEIEFDLTAPFTAYDRKKGDFYVMRYYGFPDPGTLTREKRWSKAVIKEVDDVRTIELGEPMEADSYIEVEDESPSLFPALRFNPWGYYAFD
jgi:hypothetical protein